MKTQIKGWMSGGGPENAKTEPTEKRGGGTLVHTCARARPEHWIRAALHAYDVFFVPAVWGAGGAPRQSPNVHAPFDPRGSIC